MTAKKTKNPMLTVIEYWLVNGKYKTKVVPLEHKERVLGRNIVAVIDGRMCRKRYGWGYCKWCDALENRCASRRVA